MAAQTMYNRKTVNAVTEPATDDQPESITYHIRVEWFDSINNKSLLSVAVACAIETDGELPPLQIAQMCAYGIAQCVQDAAAPHKAFSDKLTAMRTRAAAIKADEYRLNARGAGMVDADVYEAACRAGVIEDNGASRDIWRDLSKAERAAIRRIESVAAELAKMAADTAGASTADAALAKFGKATTN